MFLHVLHTHVLMFIYNILYSHFLFFLLSCILSSRLFYFFFFNDTATTEIYTLSLHDALPIYARGVARGELLLEVANGLLPTQHLAAPVRLLPAEDEAAYGRAEPAAEDVVEPVEADRKSTRLNSSHGYISYAVFCLKKKKQSALDRGTYASHQIEPPASVLLALLILIATCPPSDDSTLPRRGAARGAPGPPLHPRWL